MKEVSGETWLKIVCECGATNFVYIGYFPDSDASRLDVEGYKCWSCKKEFYFDVDADPEEVMYIKEGNPISVFWTIA